MLNLEDAAEQAIQEEMISEVRRGLMKRPRSLAPWMFYDDYGSALFERITSLRQYYPTRTERHILARNAEAVISAVLSGESRSLRIFELGAGSASKTSILLKAAVSMHAKVLYIPVDVSPNALTIAHQSIEFLAPHVRTEPIVINYVTCPPKLDPFDGPTLLLYLGSSIGNFSPSDARAILRNLSQQMQSSDALVLGVDLVKDVPTLISAYDDDQGVTAAFNLNVLRRLNRELEADFDLNLFQHRARWNEVDARIEMHLESTIDQRVCIKGAGLDLIVNQGETIHTENSYKFTETTVADLFRGSGLRLETAWKDESSFYAVALARASATMGE